MITQTENLVRALKLAIKQRRKTYADIAQVLDLSEISIKRLFAKKDLSLARLEKICHSIGITISELIELANQTPPPISQLTPEQEQELASNPKLLLATYLALNRWSFKEMMQFYEFSEHELIRLLARLEKLNILQLLPLNKIRLLTSRNFSWQKNGPIQKIYTEQVHKEFFNHSFEQLNETLVFMGGSLSENSLMQLGNRIRELAQEFDQLAEKDQKLPRETKMSAGAVFAVRPIEFPMFKKYKRNKGSLNTMNRTNR